MKEVDMECSSFHCANYHCDYCKKCSHANFFQEQEYNGKLYRWTFSPMWGPLFCNKDWNDCKCQPVSPYSVKWKAFELYQQLQEGAK